MLSPEPAVQERLTRVRATLDEMYSVGAVETMEGLMHPLLPHAIDRESGEAIRAVAVQHGVKRTLEVGLGLAASCLFLCEAVLTNGGGDEHVAIDPFQEAYWRNAGLIAVEKAGVSGMLDHRIAESQLLLPKLVEEGREFDLILIDGDHRYESCFVDAYFCDRMIAPGGLVVIDDCWMPAIELVVSYLTTNLGYELLTGVSPAEYSVRASWRTLGRRRGTGVLAVLKAPSERPERDWQSFTPFA